METQNLAFYSSNCAEGEGTGIVIATGDNTVIGHIAKLTSGLEKEQTPMKLEIQDFVKYITILAVTIGIVFFVMALAIGYDIFQVRLFQYADKMLFYISQHSKKL